MNQSNQNQNSVTFQLNGQLTINRQGLKTLFAALIPANLPAAPTSHAVATPPPPKPQRLAYTMKETAEILGVSYITVHRLIQRRLLKPSLALRCKIIPLAEIERFLKETAS